MQSLTWAWWKTRPWKDDEADYEYPVRLWIQDCPWHPRALWSQLKHNWYLFFHRMRWEVDYFPEGDITEWFENSWASFHRTLFGALAARYRQQQDPDWVGEIRLTYIRRSEW